MITRSTLYRCCVIACVLALEAECLGADYYVDATGGSDDNTGLSSSAAWKTMSKVNSYTGLAPGDRILLQRGRTWREQLTVPRSGTSGSPIVFGAYGSGSNPILKGSALVTGWASAGSNRWSASLGAAPNQVFFNGVRGTMKGGTGSLTAARDWYWGSGVLYVYATSDPDSAYTAPGVEASVRPSSRSYGIIHMAAREYITIQDIDVSQSASFGIYIRPSSHYITLRGCDVGDSLDGGIVASRSSTPTTQITVENCSVHHNNGGFLEGEPGVATYHEGLTMEGVDGFVIRGTQVYANYMEGVNFKQGAKNGIIENSLLYDNALINQYIEGASNIQVRYNKIYNCDWNAGIELGMETSTYSNDRISIHHNLIYNNNDGVNYWAMGSVTGQIQNVSIDNNTFYNNANYALRWKSGATDNVAGANYFRNNIVWGRGIQDETTGDEGLSGMTISYNAFQSGISTDTSGSNAKTISNAGFANAGANDFHLTSSSPCINAGTSVGLTRDFDGTSIPQGGAPDIGAYEYGSGTPATYTLTVSATNGTVTKSPNQSSYTSGTSVTVQATPNTGYTFTGWSGALTGAANPATIVMDSNKSVTAGFTADSYTLTINVANGTVSKSPDKASYLYGEVVTLQAAANTGYSFAGWSGDASGANASTTVTMNANKTVTANFTANTYTLTVNATNGSVTRSPDKASYTYGEVVSLQATANVGYSFAGWSGDVSGTSPSVTVTMNANKTVTASFTARSADRLPPVLSGCSPASDAIQAPLNTLVTLHVRDEGAGVDAASVSIAVAGNPIYSGEADSCRTAHGVCRRYGTRADYTYVYQQEAPFSYSVEIPIVVNARDLAGNAMPEQAYSFATQMYSFGLNHPIAADRTGLDQGRPAAVSDSHGDTWVAWQGGSPGGRHIYVSRFSPDTAAYGGTTQLSQGTGDHCEPAMAVDGAGNLYTVWQENTHGTWDVCLSTSVNGGAWSAPKRISDANDNQVNPAVAAGRGQSSLVAVAWQDDRAGNQDVWVVRSTDRFGTTEVSRVTSNSADQTDPAVTIDCENTICVLWTDARNGSTDIYGAASNNGPWTNVPIVNSGGNQSHPAIASGSTAAILHILWEDDARGNADVYYASSRGMPAGPLAGVNIIDDTSGADQRAPVIAVAAQASGADRIFACWEDARNLAHSGDTDLYFADLSAGATSTNVLVDDEGTNSDQKDAALGIDRRGFPYVVWADDARTNLQVYCCGATYADPAPVVEQEIAASAGVTVGTSPADIAAVDDVSVVIPAQACPVNAAISIAQVRNPQGFSTESLRIYEFGPSGLAFTQPVTITVPYGVRNTGKIRAYWYDSVTGTFSDRGITDMQDIAVGSGLHALQFKTTHFTPFYLVTENASGAGGSGGAGGGCSLAVYDRGNAAEYFAPWLIVAAAMYLWRRRDLQRTR